MPDHDDSQLEAAETHSPEPDRGGSPAEEATSNAEHCSLRQRLGQFLILHTEPAPVPTKLPFFKPDNDVRRLRHSQNDLVRALRNEFTDPQLVRARFLVPDQTESRNPFDPIRAREASCSRHCLTPVLTSPLFVLERDNDQVLDVTANCGALWQKDPPGFRLALERRPPHHHARDLIVAESAAIPFFRQLHLRVTSMAAWDQLSGPQMRKLFARQSNDQAPYFRVILVAWDVPSVTNQLTEHAKRVLQRFYDWQIAVGYDPEKMFIHVWAPRSDQFEQIRIATEFGDKQLVKLKIRASVQADARNAPDAWQKYLDSREVTIGTAVTRLRTLIAQPGIASRRDAGLAAKAFRQRNTAMISDYYRVAEAAQNPAEALRWLALAQEHEDFVNEHPMLIAADQIAAGDRVIPFQKLDATATVLRERQIARMLRLTDSLGSSRR